MYIGIITNGTDKYTEEMADLLGMKRRGNRILKDYGEDYVLVIYDAADGMSVAYSSCYENGKIRKLKEHVK